MSTPLPIANLIRRAWNGKEPKARHDTAYYAWEASVRLAVAAQPPADTSPLELASVGHWVSAMTPAVGERPLDDAALLAVYEHLCAVGLQKNSSPRSVSARKLLDALPPYRNHVLGHGAVRDAAFYDRAAEVLVKGLERAWDEGVFWPVGTRLLHVDAVELTPSGGRRARLLELSGVASSVVDPRGSTDLPPDVLPQRLYLRSPERSNAWVPMHPWLLYHATELREQVLFFNGRGAQARYLDYVSGEELKGKALAQAFPTVDEELKALFGSQRGGVERTVSSEDNDPAAFGDYRLLGKLGEGGMGVVYVARQESLGRLVALKVLPANLADDATAVARFQREVAALSRCDHPNIVKVFGSGKARDAWFFSMELVEGADLAQIAQELPQSEGFDDAVSTAADKVRAKKAQVFEHIPQVPKPSVKPTGWRDPVRALALLFRDAARAVQHLHDQGIVHRDIKPANLMLTAIDHRVVLMDLGLAVLGDASRSLTKDKNALLGTLRYMPPEQLQRSLFQLDHRADVYSLGATFYELLCGRPLYEASSEAHLIQQVIFQKPLAPQKANPRLPPDLGRILAKALEKDASQRYQTAEALAADLDAFLDGRPIGARPPTLGYVFRLAIRRNRALAATIAGALALVIALATVHVRGLRVERKNALDAEARAESNLADALAARALSEDSLGDRMRAELLAAHVLRRGERPELRGLVIKLANSFRPVRAWSIKLPARCDRLALSPDARVVLCASKRGLSERGLRDGGDRRVLDRGEVSAVAVSPDGKRVAWTAREGAGGLLHVADWPLGGNAHAFPSASPLTSVAVARDVVAGAEDGNLLVVRDGAPRFLRAHKDAVTALAFQPGASATRFAAGSEDDAISVGALDDGEKRETLRGHADDVTDVTWLGDGTIVSASDDSTVRLWTGGREPVVLDAHDRAVNTVAAAGRLVVSGGRERTVRIWDDGRKRELGRLSGFADTIRALALSPDGTWLVVASDDQRLAAFELDAGARSLLDGGAQQATAVGFSDDGRWLAAGSSDGNVRVWPAPFGAQPPRLLTLASPVWTLAFSPGTSRLLTGGEEAMARLWDAATGERVGAPLPVPDEALRVRSVAISPNGALYATGGKDGLVRLFRADGKLDGEPLAASSAGQVYALAFSPKGDRLATAARDGSVRVYDATTRAPVGKPIVYPVGWATSVAFSPDGNTLVTGWQDDRVRVIDARSGELLRTLAGHDGWVLSVAVSPDGKLIASGSEDRTVRLWSLESGAELARLVDHHDMVWSVAFSPKGDLLASASRDRAVRLWPLEALRAPADALYQRAVRDFGLEVAPSGALEPID